MRRRLLLSYITLTAFVLVLLEVPLGIGYQRGEQRALLSDLTKDAFVLASFVEDALEPPVPSSVDLAARRYQAQSTGGRVVIVDRSGRSLEDTASAGAAPEDFSTRPEFKMALAGRTANGTRYSATLHTTLLYVAVPVASGGRIHGAVRITFPGSELGSRIARTWRVLGLVGLVILAAVAVIGWQLAWSVSRPVRRLELAAKRIAGSDLATRVPEDAGPAEVRELARAFNEMSARIQELLDAQRAFVADASHQLRTPLTALRLRLESLEDSAGAAADDDVDAALREVVRLSRLVDGLLALARAEGARPERAHVNVDEIVRGRVLAWEPFAAEHDVHLAADGTGGVASAVAGHMEQILDNLLSNAFEVAPAGSTVRISCERTSTSVEVHVIDAGPGLTAEARSHAFDRFWRRSPDGTGLGLAIVRQLVTACGGEVDLRDAPGGGVDAVVRLVAA